MIYPFKLIFLVFVITLVGFKLCGCGESAAKPTTHQCSDKTHLECDGGCECDGLACPVNGRDYQIEVYNDTVWLYDGQRLVGSYISTWKNQMDTILLNDNQ